MSIEHVARALLIQGLTPAEKLCFVGMANHDGDGGCWPSVSTLATYVGVSPRQVQRLIRALEEKGLVVTEQNGGGSRKTPDHRRPNLYRLTYEGVTPTSPGDTDVTGTPDASVTPPPDTGVTRTSLENQPVNQPPVNGKPLTELQLHRRRTQAIVDAWWESLEVKPAQPYIAIVGVVSSCIRAGWTEDECARALREAPTVSGAAFDLWRNTRHAQATSEAWITELLNDSVDFFRQRDLLEWRHANIDALRATIRTLGAWGFDRGETMIRLAIAARHPQDMANPTKLSRLPRVERFNGLPDNLSAAMETAYRNLAWRAS